ncbi:MAG: maleylacetoacetate isomerase [Kordiimonas sp.]
MRKLYGYYRSSAAYRVRIALALKELEYEHVGINLLPGVSEQLSDTFVALNPQGRVPYFVDGDMAVAQSPAILEYLEESYPDRPLLPNDIIERARVRQLVNIIACDTHPLMNLAVTQFLKGSYDIEQEGIMKWYRHWMPEGLSAFEAVLTQSAGTGRFCHGDQPGMADLYLIPQLYNARRFNISLDKYPLIQGIDEACAEITAFKEAEPENQPDAPKS